MKKVLSTLGSVFVALLLIFSVTMTVMVILGVHSEIGIPTLMGYSIMSVQTDSMESPEGFYVGDLIVVKAVDEQEAENLKVGDVITFWRYIGSEPYLETHRIIENTYETINKYEVVDGVRVHNGIKAFVTRGDNTPGVDTNPESGELEYKTPGQVLAVWTGVAIPKLGGIFDFLKSQTGFMVCVVVPVLLFFVYQLYVFIMTLSRKQKEKALEEVSSKEEELKQKAIAEFLAQQQAQGVNIATPNTKPEEGSDSSERPEPVEEPESSEKAEPAQEPKPAEDDKPADEKNAKKSKKDKKSKHGKNAETAEEKAEEKPEEKTEDEKSEEKAEDEKSEEKAEDEKSEEKAEDEKSEEKAEAEKPEEKAEDEKSEEEAKDEKSEAEEAEDEKPEDEKPEEKAEGEKLADASDISEEEKNRIIQEYLAKQAQEKKPEE